MGNKTQVFRSPDDIPSALRQQLAASTRGMNSATILIADRGGRAEIRKILNGEPSPLKSRLRADFLKRSLGDKAAPTAGTVGVSGSQPRAWNWNPFRGKPIQPNMRLWVELLLPGIVGVGLWLLFTWR